MEQQEYIIGPDGSKHPLMTEQEKILALQQLEKDMNDYQRQQDKDKLESDLCEILSMPEVIEFKRLSNKAKLPNQQYQEEEFNMIFHLINRIDKTNKEDTGCGSCRTNALKRLKQLYDFYYPE